MLYWIIVTTLALGVAVTFGSALRRPRDSVASSTHFDLQVYRDQLKDIDKDVARGVLAEDDAERVRTEISRRILAADAAHRSDTQDTTGPIRVLPWTAVLAVCLIGGSLALYSQLGAPGYADMALADRIAAAEEIRTSRPSQNEAESALPDDGLHSREATPEFLELVEQLRKVVAERPDDLRGLRLLARQESNLGNFAAAYRAQDQIVALLGAEATAQDFADLATLLMFAAAGYVSPEAEAALVQALERDPSNGSARYAYGLMLIQTGRPDRAFRMWDALLREGPQDAPWIDPILAQIEDAAFRAGVNYSIPDIGSARGPTAADIDAAGEMSAQDRMQMIEGMVSGLSERLASQGGSAQEWAQLITALGVLGRSDAALQVYSEAREVFAADPSATDLINRAGEQAGVAN